MSYHRFSTPLARMPGEPEEYGSFEVFQVTSDFRWGGKPAGWYWHACFPGCLPDGDPIGPFATEQEAIENANS